MADAKKRAAERPYFIEPGKLTAELQGGAAEVEMSQKVVAEKAKRGDADDSAYYFVAVFQSREQCDAVLKAIGLLSTEQGFVNGVEMIDALKLPVAKEPRTKHRLPVNRAWLEFVGG